MIFGLENSLNKHLLTGEMCKTIGGIGLICNLIVFEDLMDRNILE